MFSFFKKKKTVSHIRLSGVIGNVGKFKQGIDYSSQEEIIKKAFSLKKAQAVAITINSPGGSVTSGMAIYDTMQFCKPDVSTLCIGQAASMGAVLLAGGANKKRFALANSRVMIHQPLGGFQGQSTDIQIHAKEIQKVRENLNSILSKHTGNDINKISKDTDRDNFMNAKEAQDYGIVDGVLESRKDIK